jgi:hypothetical protein
MNDELKQSVSSDNAKSVYEKEYLPYVVSRGMSTTLLGVGLCFLPLAILYFKFGLLPPMSAVITGVIAQISVSGVFYVVEPVSYFTILGIPGTYMSFLSGNIGNLRVPCSAIAQDAASVEKGTPEGSVVSTIGVAVSVLVNVILLTIGVLLGTTILSMLPVKVYASLNFLLPALFGAILGQQFVKSPKVGLICIPLGLLMTCLYKFGYLKFLPGTPVYAVIIVTIFGTILIARKLKEKGWI